MKNVPELFGSLVFNDNVMKAKLPKDVYKALKKTVSGGKHLDLDIANVVATVMKDWALEKGATHFTHWFQPMTGITAEKHDSFISPDAAGNVIMEFSGKELVKGEPDASSFPSGGLRATFEARGYTAWDPTSYAFIKDGTLCIPTAFCSYSGEALDEKTPLLRSMEAVDKQTMRILKLFGEDGATRVLPTVGPEQEYFLIDKAAYLRRPDLIYTGRTLFGCKPPKGQELEDHYFGTIKPRVSAFMKELDEELWKLGVLAKTKHNEVAPAQHELAPIFTTTNIATDHNQLTMETMKSVANRHGMVCLLHEKPFAGVNGSGKHNNWSLATDNGINLLEPGNTPSKNARFLLVLAAIIKAVDDYQDLLRISVASAGNDHRLGANEAPPAIVSMFVGEELAEILEALESDNGYTEKEKKQMQIGVNVLPHFPKDTTDRNRTSPFAFTGNKFEFRMLGSSFSIAEPNIVLNTIVAEIFSQLADQLEKSTDFESDLNKIIKSTIKDHNRIIFNGNNYSDEWVIEAEKRGLLNLKSTPEALSHFLDEKNVKLYTKHSVFSESELHSRNEIMYENYCKTLNIEALTMLDIAKTYIVPAVEAYQGELAEVAGKKKKVSTAISTATEEKLLVKLSTLTDSLYDSISALESSISKEKDISDVVELAGHFRNSVFENMQTLRAIADELESLTARSFWPLPVYGELLYSVN